MVHHAKPSMPKTATRPRGPRTVTAPTIRAAPFAPSPSFATELNRIAIEITLGCYTSQILTWGFFEPRWWRNYLHAHSFYEVCYSYAGTGVFRIAGREHAIGAGDLFVAKPREEHEIVSSKRDPLGIYFWSYTLLPAERPRGGASRGQPVPPRGIDALLDAFTRSTRWVRRDASAVQRTLELMTYEVNTRQPGYCEAVRGLAGQLLLETARGVVDETINADSPAPPVSSAAEAIVHQADRYLRDNLGTAVLLRDVAAQVHLSERQLNRLFTRVLGVTVMDRLTRIRVEAASQLLLDRDMPIKRVAAASGYPSINHFSNVFRRHAGVSPSQFRSQGGTHFLRRQRHSRVQPAH